MCAAPAGGRKPQPDTEGIETVFRTLHASMYSRKPQPDTEGIETGGGIVASRVLQCRKPQPDTEGIETYKRYMLEFRFQVLQSQTPARHRGHRNRTTRPRSR